MIAGLENHLWQSTLFTAAAALLAVLLRRHGAHVRYWLWFAASAKYLLPFALLTALGHQIGRAAVSDKIPVAWSTTVGNLVHPVATSPSSTVLALVLAVVWLAGALTVLIVWLEKAARIRAVLRASEARRRPLPHVPVTVPVRYSAAALEPAVVGIRRPVLLLPRDIDRRLTQPQLKAVLAHELCHLRRRDNVAAVVHLIVEAVFWFHPLVWWIGARLLDERERACDEAVVRAGHDRLTYAEGILRICELYVSSSLACVAGVSGTNLQRRIASVMRNRPMIKLTTAKKLLLLAFGLCVLTAPVIGGWLASDGTALAQSRRHKEYLPIVKVAPIYPAEALARHLEGYVIVEYTVEKNGSVKDVRVVKSSSPIFEQAAISSASKYKYQPTILNGKPIEVTGVRTKITWVLDRKPPITPPRR